MSKQIGVNPCNAFTIPWDEFLKFQECKNIILLDLGLTLWLPNLHVPTQARGGLRACSPRTYLLFV